ncbi:uncharacterized protein LOC116610623 [Nematostella vectensis]|uniref:uncharacterized protein LOC116610623 n=1 Tax=Nematostella vectensis TaxID=45351 RepID=UPI00138FB1FE|nr:uncharacterized protein LOC116610623 [Nematostella vectensis]
MEPKPTTDPAYGFIVYQTNVTYHNPPPTVQRVEETFWLDTLSPAERIAIILSCTILLTIILTGICYHASSLCKSRCRRGEREVARERAESRARDNNGQLWSQVHRATAPQGPIQVRSSQNQLTVPQVVIYNTAGGCTFPVPIHREPSSHSLAHLPGSQSPRLQHSDLPSPPPMYTSPRTQPSAPSAEAVSGMNYHEPGEK